MMGRGLKVARHAVAGAPHRRTASAAHVSLLRPHVQRQLPRSTLQEAIQTRSSLPALIARYPVVTGLRRLRNAMTPSRSRARSIDSSPDGRRAPVERSSNRYLKLNRIPQVRPATRSSLCTNQLSRWEPAPRRMGGQAPAVTRRSHGRPARPPIGSHICVLSICCARSPSISATLTESPSESRIPTVGATGLEPEGWPRRTSC